ncbi:MAG: GNAT family N-acetyltransferase [Caulobacter sp.]
MTDRLDVRPFCEADIARLIALFADPNVSGFVGDGRPLTHDDASLWVQKSAENIKRYGYGTGAIERRRDGRVIGWAGFARPTDGPEQIVYGLGADHWRQGYGSEIVEALVGFADGRDMPVTWATVDPQNLVSVHLLCAVGFELVERAYGGDLDCDLYRRTRPSAPRVSPS